MRFHPAGQDMKVWAEAISDSAYSEYKSTVASLTAFGSTNGGTPSSLTGVSAEFDADMDMFLVTIPSGQLPANGNNFFAKVDWAGIIDVKIEAYITDISTLAAINKEVDTAISDAAIVSKIDTVDTVVDGIATTLATPDNFKADVSALATSAEITLLNNLSMSDIETACGSAITDAAIVTKIDTVDTVVDGIQSDITAIKGAGWTDETLVTIQAAAETGGSGAEKIVPADKYAFDASAKTLTFSSPYDTLTVEQVTFIKNLTTNYIIWDCKYSGYQTLPVRFGAAPNTHVLSFDSSDSDAANEDKIMIVVNQAD